MFKSPVPAPVDRAAAARSCASHGCSVNLPQESYISSAVFDWEMENLWASGWLCVGRTESLPASGASLAVTAGREGILLVRDSAGVLRAFFNVCRHRGHEVLRPGESSSAPCLRCPYHGWTYDLDGRLRSAPRAGEMPGFDPSTHGLVPARVEEWHGWVWLNASGDAPPLSEWLGDLEELVAPYTSGLLRRAVEKSYDVAANWKLVHENFHECYHCTSIHPQLCKVTPVDSGRSPARSGAWVGGPMDLMDHAVTMSLDGHSDGVPIPGLPRELHRQVRYFGVVPNLFLSLHPDYVLTHRIEPLAADRIRIHCEWMFPPEAFSAPGFSPDYAFRFWDVTNLQDWAALESVQRGVSSRGYRPGPLTVKEDAVQQFVSRIARAYLDGFFDPAPATSAAAR